MSDRPAVHPDRSLLAAVEAKSGQKISACYQCRKCANGCPLAFAMDVMPNQVMRMVELGMEEELLRSRTIWICASCQTCTTRCPNDIDVAGVMDALRQLSLAAGVAAERNVVHFHKALLDSVRRHGRVFELAMVGRYKLASGDILGDVKLGCKMLRRNKLKLLPKSVRGKAEIRSIFDH
jgi:heterodisulfide reductase subunit C